MTELDVYERESVNIIINSLNSFFKRTKVRNFCKLLLNLSDQQKILLTDCLDRKIFHFFENYSMKNDSKENAAWSSPSQFIKLFQKLGKFFFNLNSCDQMEVLKILDDTSEEDDSDCCGCRQEPPDKKEDQYHLFNSINREYSDTTSNFESNSTQFWL